LTSVAESSGAPQDDAEPLDARRSWWRAIDVAVALPFLAIVALRWFGQSLVLGVWTAAFSIWLLWPVWPLAVAAFIAKRRALGVVLVLVACVHATWLVRERGIAGATPRGPRLTIFTANIFDGNRHIAATAPDIIRSHADVVFLQELRPAHLEKLEAAGAFAAYPYHVIDPENGSVGSGIWSRYPLRGTTISCGDHPMTEGAITFDGRQISVFNAHSEAPIGTTEMHRWRAQLACVAENAKQLVARGPTIIAGDFNATTALAPLQRILDAGLTDTQSERGAVSPAPIRCTTAFRRCYASITCCTRATSARFRCTSARPAAATTGNSSPSSLSADFHRPRPSQVLRPRCPIGVLSLRTGWCLVDQPVSVVFGCTGSGIGARGGCVKSKSEMRLPRIPTSSRTVGRGSGRPSVFGSSRWLFKKSSSMNFAYASKLNV
jgi:endonuclease/exonuclease/phosphatase (EEP) superfamily protein YafD